MSFCLLAIVDSADEVFGDTAEVNDTFVFKTNN